MACIYEITVGEEIYIGSTCNYKMRMTSHKSVAFNSKLPKSYNMPLYKAIRANNGIYDTKILYTLQDGEVKFKVEREWYDKLKPTLNGYKPVKNPRDEKMTCDCGAVIVARHIKKHLLSKPHLDFMNPDYIKPIPPTLEEINSQRRETYEKTKSTILCECGCTVSKMHINAHRKTKKHIARMNTDYKEPIILTEEQKKEKKREYNKEHGLIRKLLTVTCECGRVVKKKDIAAHRRRKCHTDIMNS
jgi:hypothetical protein